MPDQQKPDSILEINREEQYHTVDELFNRSQPDSVYYSLLVLSAVIVAVGLLLNNSPIVIGGMLVAPVLTPILVIALGLSVGTLKPVKRESWLLAKSFIIVIVIALILGWIFGSDHTIYAFENSLRTAVLYFIVAIASGLAATFAWTRLEMNVALPGIAVAVSLVPPLSLVGIGLSVLDPDLTRFYLFVLIFNVLGILVGSLVAFSLLKFHRATRKVEEKEAETDQKNE